MADERSDELATSPGPAGRPRDGRIDERVLAATRASLAEVGWEATSVRGVADRAGVSRPAIARRWPSKAHLVLEAILGATPDLDSFAGADREGWIAAVIDGSFSLFDRDEVRAAAPGLLATLRDHDDIRQTLWEGFSGPASALLLDLGAPEAGADVAGAQPADPRSDAMVDAQAAIVLAAGAALFTSLIVGDDARVRDRVATGLAESLASMVSPPIS